MFGWEGPGIANYSLQAETGLLFPCTHFSYPTRCFIFYLNLAKSLRAVDDDITLLLYCAIKYEPLSFFVSFFYFSLTPIFQILYHHLRRFWQWVSVQWSWVRGKMGSSFILLPTIPSNRPAKQAKVQYSRVLFSKHTLIKCVRDAAGVQGKHL